MENINLDPSVTEVQKSTTKHVTVENQETKHLQNSSPLRRESDPLQIE